MRAPVASMTRAPAGTGVETPGPTASMRPSRMTTIAPARSAVPFPWSETSITVPPLSTRTSSGGGASGAVPQPPATVNVSVSAARVRPIGVMRESYAIVSMMAFSVALGRIAVVVFAVSGR